MAARSSPDGSSPDPREQAAAASLVAARLRAQRRTPADGPASAAIRAVGVASPSRRSRGRAWLGYSLIAAITVALFAAVGTSSLALGRNNARSVDPSVGDFAAARVQATAPIKEPLSVAEAQATAADGAVPDSPADTPLANPVYDPSLLPFPAGPPVDIPTTERRATPPAGTSTSDIDRWLEMAGWPPYLREEAKRVSWCESRWHPDSINGNARGLFQIWQDMRPRAWGWFWYFGYDPNTWTDPVKNAEIALFVYNLDLMRGLHPWAQWECKP